MGNKSQYRSCSKQSVLSRGFARSKVSRRREIRSQARGTMNRFGAGMVERVAPDVRRDRVTDRYADSSGVVIVTTGAVVFGDGRHGRRPPAWRHDHGDLSRGQRANVTEQFAGVKRVHYYNGQRLTVDGLQPGAGIRIFNSAACTTECFTAGASSRASGDPDPSCSTVIVVRPGSRRIRLDAKPPDRARGVSRVREECCRRPRREGYGRKSAVRAGPVRDHKLPSWCCIGYLIASPQSCLFGGSSWW